MSIARGQKYAPYANVLYYFCVEIDHAFIFLIIQGLESDTTKYHEVGRSMATCFSDEVFQELAYKARHANHIIAGLDEFLDSVTVIPPGEWDPSIRIEPPDHVASQNLRKNPNFQPPCLLSEDEQAQKSRSVAGLFRSGRIFGGLIDDIKRKWPQYVNYQSKLQHLHHNIVLTKFFMSSQ